MIATPRIIKRSMVFVVLASVVLILWAFYSLNLNYSKNGSPEIFRNSNDVDNSDVDIHSETDDENLLHDVKKHQGGDFRNYIYPRIALGLAVTSVGIADISERNMIYRFPFFRSLLPSFCRSISKNYNYAIYLAFDSTDSFFGDKPFINAFHQNFNTIISKSCTHVTGNVTLHFIECSHTGNPARAQNDAMMEAYLDGCEYFYRINDDIQFLSPGWTEEFVATLHDFNPPNVGVVGPMHSGGKESILTFDFVHRTHVNIFGFYYPRLFTDWWADDWMTTVYQPEWSIKLASVKVLHTMEIGTRYQIDVNRGQLWEKRVEQDRATLIRYVSVMRSKKIYNTNVSYIISYSLWGNKAKYNYGLIRNVQLAPIIFPGWKVRVYVEDAELSGEPVYKPVPQRILDTVLSLGAEVYKIDVRSNAIPPMMWRFLVADDDSVDVFIVRDSDSRLNDRDFAAVNAWLQSNAIFHCIRDHPSHAIYVVSGGLWGARRKELNQVIKIPWRHLTTGISAGYGQDLHFMASAIWPRVLSVAICHDSVACTKWPSSVAMPTLRVGLQHVGQVFDENEVPRQEDLDLVLGYQFPSECNTLEKKKVDDQIVDDILSFNPFIIPANKSPISMIYSNKVIAKDLQNIFRLLNYEVVAFHCSELSLCISTNRWRNVTLSDLYNRIASSIKVIICFMPDVMCEILMHSDNKILTIFVVTDQLEASYFVEAHRNNFLDLHRHASQKHIVSTSFYDSQFLLHRFNCSVSVLWPLCMTSRQKTAVHLKKDKVLVYAARKTKFTESFYRLFKHRILNLSEGIDVYFNQDDSTAFLPDHVSSSHAIIHIPNQMSAVDICAHYRMSVPLFFPSVATLIAWNEKYSILSEESSVDDNLLLDPSVPRTDHQTFILGDPYHDKTESNQHKWLSYADFYQWPHIHYFKGIDDLITKLLSLNLTETSELMKQHNEQVQSACVQTWKNLVVAHL